MSAAKGLRWRPPPCSSGKVAFRSQGRALEALKRIARENAGAAAPVPEGKVPKRVYRCRCGAWHLTSHG